MKAKNENLILCYACKIDFDYHLGADANGMDIYFSLDSVRHHRKCTDGCGIVTFLINKNTAKTIQEEDWEASKSKAKSIEQWIEEEHKEIKADYKRAKLRLERYEAKSLIRKKKKNAKSNVSDLGDA